MTDGVVGENSSVETRCSFFILGIVPVWDVGFSSGGTGVESAIILVDSVGSFTGFCILNFLYIFLLKLPSIQGCSN